jgi:hypothetical protein
MHRVRFVLTVALAVVAAAAAPADSLADPPPSIEQYTETVPSGAGAKAQGVHRKGKARLSSAARSQLRRAGGSDASALEKIATSSAYGAPTSSSVGTANSSSTRGRPTHGSKKPRSETETPMTAKASRPTRSTQLAADTLAAPSTGPSTWVFVTAGMVLAAALVAAAIWRIRRRASFR